MSISYSALVKELLVDARDRLRADDNLVSTLLGISGGTANAKNYIFAGRPVNQRKGFPNPRIVCEEPIHQVNKVGGNPDGIYDDIVLFQVTSWVADSPFSLVLDVNERIKVLLENADFSTTEGGRGYYVITTTDSTIDPDKEETNQGRVIVNAKLLTGG